MSDGVKVAVALGAVAALGFILYRATSAVSETAAITAAASQRSQGEIIGGALEILGGYVRPLFEQKPKPAKTVRVVITDPNYRG